MYVIWHDNDYDFALWVYENTILHSKKNVLLKQIPKTNDGALLISCFKDKNDFEILPYIKYATPDILIQKTENDNSLVLAATEFMTHTPQHDHVFQRFERIFCISNEHVPVAFVLPSSKVKIEKGSRSEYREVKYHPNPLVVHMYLKTTLINKNPTLMFFWPDQNGYLKYDQRHQTAPARDEQIDKWLDFIDYCIKVEDASTVLKSKPVQEQLSFLENRYLLQGKKFYSVGFNEYISNLSKYYNLERLEIIKTGDVIKKFRLAPAKLNKTFLDRKLTVVFSYTSRDFRTDPYCGFVCGFKNLFCIDNNGDQKLNLIHVPKGIKYQNVSKGSSQQKVCFRDFSENLSKCPVHSSINLKEVEADVLQKHLTNGCIYSSTKHQRIFGTVSDIIIFDDYIYYNKNKPND